MATENRTNSLIVPNKVDVNRPSKQGNMHLNIKVISMESILVANLNKMFVMLQTKGKIHWKSFIPFSTARQSFRNILDRFL